MELVLKIFETLGITPLAVLQMAITVILAAILSATLIRPVLQVFQERENRSSKPMEESKALLADAEGKSRQYEEAVRKSTQESIARKRAKIEEDSRAEVDATFVGTGNGELVEVQVSGEGHSFPVGLVDDMVALARKGIAELHRLQDEALKPWLPLPW